MNIGGFKMVNKFKSKKGFTLIELLVVISIIGILAVVAVPALFKNIQKSKIADLESDYNAIKSAVLSIYTEGNKLAYEPVHTSNTINEYLEYKIENTPIGGQYYIVPDMLGTDGNNYLNAFKSGYCWDGERYKSFKELDANLGEETYIEKNFTAIIRICPKWNTGDKDEKVKISEEQFKKISKDLGHDNVFITSKFTSNTEKEIYIGLIRKN